MMVHEDCRHLMLSSKPLVAEIWRTQLEERPGQVAQCKAAGGLSVFARLAGRQQRLEDAAPSDSPSDSELSYAVLSGVDSSCKAAQRVNSTAAAEAGAAPWKRMLCIALGAGPCRDTLPGNYVKAWLQLPALGCNRAHVMRMMPAVCWMSARRRPGRLRPLPPPARQPGRQRRARPPSLRPRRRRPHLPRQARRRPRARQGRSRRRRR